MGALVGTGYTARDMMRLNDVLNGPDALLNYYGVSYGTVLGATTAALFPERMGRVLLSSNVNLAEWYEGYDLAWWSDADKAVFDFFDRCVGAGPDLCALAGRNETADALDAKMYKLMDELRLDPIPVGDALVLDSSALKMAFRGILMGNQPWPMFAIVLNELFTPPAERDIQTVSAIWQVLSSATEIIGNLQDQSMFGIYCGDKATRAASFEDIFAVTEQLVDISKALGEVANNLVYLCARWPYHAKGAYDGDWSDIIETANPILFTGSRYDHVTPLGNAYNSSRIFTGSAVLPHNGIGHGVTTHPSLCTAKAMRAYFQNGTLPAEDLDCTADFDAFDTTKTWRDSYLPELSLKQHG
jgi:pimeloyl-ACP methyl ester carboxylesterase